MAAVTMPVLDRPSERAIQIRQAARQAFVESQDDNAMRRALVARPRPWREFQVGDQVAVWRNVKGRSMRSGQARWHGRAVAWRCVLDQRTCGSHTDTIRFAQGVARTIADGNNDGESDQRPGSPRAPSDRREQNCRRSGAVGILRKSN